MKKQLLRMTTFLFAVVLMVGTVSAASRSSLYLSGYRAWLTPKSGAIINVNIDVQAVGDMDNVGALSVAMYTSADGGTTWERDGTYYSALYPELLLQDTYWYYETPISHEGIAGNKYYAVVEVYAGDSTGSDSRDYVTATVTARS